MKARLPSLLMAFALVAGSVDLARGVEPVERFLEALRQGKYYDEALVYLEQVQSLPSLDKAVQQRAAYERGMTLLAQAGEPGDPALRRKQLAAASEAFEKFTAEHPQHELVGSVRNQLANILVERGRSELQAAPEVGQVAARELYAQARQQFLESEKLLIKQLEAMPKLIAPDQPEQQAHKVRLSGDVAQARLMLANIDYELAQTFAATSGEAKDHFTAAAKSYAGLHEAYRTRAVGLLARLWEGRCYEALGRYDRALGCYLELIDLPDSAETRSIRANSTRQAMECWTQETVKKYQAAIERGEHWQKERGDQATEPDDLAIRYLTAVAYQGQAKSLPEKDPNRKRLSGAARDSVQAVARQPGEYQRPAKTLLVALQGKGGKEVKETKTAPPKNFAEAFEQAQAALARMQEAAAKNATQEKNAAALQAMALLRRAIALRDGQTPAEAVNSARYYQCFLNWDLGNFYEAAVLGEHLARRYPQTLPGRQGAKIALAAWVQLYNDSKAEDRSFEVAQIQRVAEMTFVQWPDQQEAEDAALTLVNFAAAAGKVEQATEYLAKISADSPRRGQAELRAGQALWSTYLRGLREPEGKKPTDEQLQALRKQAEEVLKQGVERVKARGSVDATLATAVFSLAQIALENDNAKQALAWLEEPKFGPLTLVKANNPAATREGFAVETYKMALRAFIAADPPQLEQAEEAMNALEKLVQQSGDAKAGENLTAIYISLGRQLQEDLKTLRAAGKTKEVERTSEAFQVFLDRLLARNAGGNLPSLNWIAETYSNLGHDLEENEGSASPRAKKCYEQSASAYKQLLMAAEKDPRYQKTPDSLVAIRLRLAEAYRGAGNYDEATLAVDQVLRDKPSLLTAQVAGAAIYQARGAVDPTGYEKAIMGGSPGKDGRNRIWGWSQLSKMTMSDAKFEPTFHEARLNIVESRYRYALVEKDPQRRQKLLQAAVEDVRTTYKVRPELGGAETMAKYDRVLKRVQKALGQPETGLAEITKPPESAAATK